MDSNHKLEGNGVDNLTNGHRVDEQDMEEEGSHTWEQNSQDETLEEIDDEQSDDNSS